MPAVTSTALIVFQRSSRGLLLGAGCCLLVLSGGCLFAPIDYSQSGTGGAGGTSATGGVADPTICGDRHVSGSEQCDDGNTSPGDGCSVGCTPEVGWTCTGSDPNTCTPVCGDRKIRGAEACDDGNEDAADGCSASCEVEEHSTCMGEPSVCTVCGNMKKEDGEVCDDGNNISGDGCSSECVLEGTDCEADGGALAPIDVQLGVKTKDFKSTTEGGGDHKLKTCPSAGPDQIYRVKVLGTGFLTARLSPKGFNGSLYIREACDAGALVACAGTSTPHDGGELVSVSVNVDDVLYVHVDGVTPDDKGKYDLSLDLSIGDDCGDPIPLSVEPGTSTDVRGTTESKANNAAGDFAWGVCWDKVGENGNDVVYEISMPAPGTASVSLSPESGFDAVIYARSQCGSDQLACSNSLNLDGSESFTMNVQSTPVFLWVDAPGLWPGAGTYTLAITPSQ